MPTHIHCRHGSRESLRISVLSRSVSFTISSAIPVVQAYKSASAEHELTDRCVRDHAERVALLQLHFSTACALASHGLPWPVAVCVHVHGLWEYQMTSVKHFALGTPFKYRVMRCMLISSLSAGQRIMRAVSFTLHVSFTLYMMSARSWQVYNGFPTAVLHTAEFFFLQLNQRLCRWCSQDTWSRHKSPPDQARQSRLGCTNSCFNRVSTSCFSR